jgi:type IV pilus assembly protein PilW
MIKALNHKTDSGFTMVELLVAIALSAVAMTAVYSTYRSQQNTYIVETQVAAMQQNLRAAMYYIEREMRLAGCDPLLTGDMGVVSADTSTLNFTMDITGGETDGKDNDGDDDIDESTEDIYGDGDADDTNEDVTYALDDNDNDGDMDLERNGNLIAENIDALNFIYLDSDLTLIASPVADPSDIRFVQVTIVAKAGQGDINFENTAVYKNQQDETIFTANDNLRRIRLTSHINCRNLGL